MCNGSLKQGPFFVFIAAVDGSLALVGAPEHLLPVEAFSLLPYRRSLAGSSIGGIAETGEMFDFCGRHNIVSDIEMINIHHINEAYEGLLKGDVKYRFVINMASLKKASLDNKWQEYLSPDRQMDLANWQQRN